MKHRLLFFKLFIVFLISCNENETVLRGYPKVTTLKVLHITEKGAVFNAQIEYPTLSEILDHGFVWGEKDTLSIEKSEAVSLGIINEPAFTKEIRSALDPQKFYWMRAFVKTKDKTIYGKAVIFKSLGSSKPLISALLPDEGYIGDTITIIGKYFSVRKEYLNVSFSQIQIPILTYNDSIIKVIVPPLPLDSVIVKVRVSNNNSNEAIFRFMAPTFEKIYPEKPSLCDTITISGERFSDDLSKMKLNINDQEITILSASSNKIKFLATTYFNPPVNLALKVFDYNLERSLAFEQVSPEITSINNPISIYDTLKIKGKNFPECVPLFAYIDFINDRPEIIRYTANEIYLTFKNYACLPQSFIINLFAAKEFKTPLITAKQSKIFSISPDSATFNEKIVIRGENFSSKYLTLRLQHPQLNEERFIPFEFISPQELTFKIPSDFRQPPEQLLDISIGGCYTSLLPKAFHIKHPVITSFTPQIITDPNQIVTLSGQNFNPSVSRNVVYFGNQLIPASDIISATNSELKVNISSLFSQNLSKIESLKIIVDAGGQTAVSSNTISINYKAAWTKLADFPSKGRRDFINFSIGNIAYVGLGKDIKTGQALSDLWAYDPINDSWTQLADFEGGARSNSTVVVLNDKAYVGLGVNYDGILLNDWWELNPSTKSWTQKASLPAAQRSNAYSFALSNKGYVGGGMSMTSSFSIKDFWEFDSNSNVWSSKNLAPSNDQGIYSFFEFKDKGYCYQPDTNGFLNQYSYDPLLNSWMSTISAINLSGGGWSYLKFKEFIVGIRNASIVKINPAQNTMATLQPPYTGFYRYQGASFVINNIGYYGLGYGDYNYNIGNFDSLIDFWAFDPTLLK
jgi:hypothetical protein